MVSPRPRTRRVLVGVAIAIAGCGSPLIRQGYEQTYRPAPENWAFRDRYADVDGLINGFDYGHAIVYERLVVDPSAAPRRLEDEDFDYITQQLLVHPPSLPGVEQAIGPHYTNLVPEVAETFEWSHMLHRQLYDICAEPGLSEAEREARVALAIRYYRSRHDVALSTSPKSMVLMEGQGYSLAFRRQDPKFNGLLWSYHWMQMALYDALMAAPAGSAEQHANVGEVVSHFWSLVHETPAGPPSVMPMSAVVAPRFSARYPEAAIIFDNLHSLHDVVSDILTSPTVPRARKRAQILHAAAAYRDSTTAVTSRAEWVAMATMMGAEAMGGVALGERSTVDTTRPNRSDRRPPLQ